MSPNDHFQLQFGDLAITRSSESCSLVGYIPVPNDPPTIGWGHTGPEVYVGLIWTQFKADSQLLIDMSVAENTVKRCVTFPLSFPEFIALCDLCFNIGSGNFESSTLVKLINQGEELQAADQILLWKYAHGKILQGLVTRRAADRQEFLTGLQSKPVVTMPSDPGLPISPH